MDPNFIPFDEAIRLAKDAIHHDPRRTPYGHHQRGRDRAIRTLDRLLAEHQANQPQG